MVTISTPTYTVLADDYYILSSYVGTVDVTFPVPSAAIKGRELVIFDLSGVGTIQVPAPNTPIGSNVTVPPGQGAHFLCTGLVWICTTGY